MTSLLIIAAIGQIQAQSCISQRQVYFPVQYQQQGYVQQNYVQEEVKFIPVIDRQELYIGLVGQAQRAAERQAQTQQATASTDQKIDQLTRLVLDLQKRLESQQNDPPIPNKPASSSVEPARPALPALNPPASESVPPPPTVTQASTNATHAGALVLAKHCAECHGKNGTRKGGRQFFDRSGTVLQADATVLSAMRDEILAGSMPPRDRPPLTLREFASINELVNQQAGELALAPTSKKGKKS